MKKLSYSIFSLVMAFVITLSSLALAPASVAYAQGENPPASQDPAKVVRILERAYQRELEWLDQQEANLDRARALGDKIQNLIDQARENGKDVTALQAALDAALAKLGDAQVAHDEAASILSIHSGFDENGKVTDRQAARKTVVDARIALRKAHHLMVQAGQDLRHAFRKWRAEQSQGS